MIDTTASKAILTAKPGLNFTARKCLAKKNDMGTELEKRPCAAIKAENELLRLRLERSEESREQLIQRIVRLTKRLDAAEHRIIELLGDPGSGSPVL